jgi:hypothetical protein
MTTEEKQQLISQLLLVDKGSVWGIMIDNFVTSINSKSDEDIQLLVSSLQDQINDNPEQMKIELGNSYEFIKELKINNQ